LIKKIHVRFILQILRNSYIWTKINL